MPRLGVRTPSTSARIRGHEYISTAVQASRGYGGGYGLFSLLRPRSRWRNLEVSPARVLCMCMKRTHAIHGGVESGI